MKVPLPEACSDLTSFVGRSIDEMVLISGQERLRARDSVIIGENANTAAERRQRTVFRERGAAGLWRRMGQLCAG